MRAPTTLTTHYPVTPSRRTRTRLPLPARSEAGHPLRAAAATLILAITSGPGYLASQLRPAWHRLRLLARDDAGYTARAVLITAILLLIAAAAGAILWTQVIATAIHTKRTY